MASKGPSGTVLETPAARSAAPAPRRHKPFVFSNLPKLGKSELQLGRRLHWVLPEGLLTGESAAAVKERLHRVFDDDAILWLDYIHAVPPKGLPKVISDPTVLGVIALSPHAPRGLIEMELALAHQLIDMLLGAGESPVVRPLTEIEQGVISYVLLEAFKAISPSPSEEGRDRLRLERIVSIDEGLALFEQESAVAVVEFKALVGQAAGFIRLMLPASAINAAVPPEASQHRREVKLQRIKAKLGRLSTVRAWLRCEVGGAELSAHDARALRPGDVMLLDALTTRIHKGEAGTGRLKLGAGRAGHIEASLEVADGHYRAKLEKVELGAAPFTHKPEEPPAEAAPEAPAEDHKPSPEDEFGLHDDVELKTAPGVSSLWDEEEKTNVTTKTETAQAEAAELLNDVPLQVAVELSRIPVTAEEVVALHVGKVLELGRAPGEPVDLSVNGKIVARGELVEIEGQLGVRIVSLSE